jgi:nickel/cobalt exporter
MTENRRAHIRITAAIVAATAVLVLLQNDAAWAVKSPFGIATPDSAGPAFTGPLGGFFAWVAFYQAKFYTALTSTLAAIKGSGHAVFLLAGISFLYGVFHAVGPGHGKAVITSYLLVSRQTVRRGVVIALAAAVAQGLTAIGVVVVAAVILRATAIGMTHATDWFEIMSYGLVAAVGAWLTWAKTFGGGHQHHVSAPIPARAQTKADAEGDCQSAHVDDDDEHAHHHHPHDCGYDHDHGHGHDEAGHSHVPDPRLLSRPLTVSRAWAAILAVGIRPCSGAIIVLVFALSQGLLLAGIGSVLAMSLGTFVTVSFLAALTVSAKDVALRVARLDSEMTERIMRVVEIGGALVVLLLGLTLLGGALQGGLPG